MMNQKSLRKLQYNLFQIKRRMPIIEYRLTVYSGDISMIIYIGGFGFR